MHKTISTPAPKLQLLPKIQGHKLSLPDGQLQSSRDVATLGVTAKYMPECQHLIDKVHRYEVAMNARNGKPEDLAASPGQVALSGSNVNLDPNVTVTSALLQEGHFEMDGSYASRTMCGSGGFVQTRVRDLPVHVEHQVHGQTKSWNFSCGDATVRLQSQSGSLSVQGDLEDLQHVNARLAPG